MADQSTEPTMPDPRRQPAEPDVDVAMVPVREVLSWLAATIAGPVGEHVMAVLPAKPERWSPAGQLVSSLNLLADAATGLVVDWDEAMAEAGEPPDETDVLMAQLADMAAGVPAPEPEADDIVVTVEPSADKVVDLMAALERSVAAAKDARVRRQQPRGEDG